MCVFRKFAFSWIAYFFQVNKYLPAIYLFDFFLVACVRFDPSPRYDPLSGIGISIWQIFLSCFHQAPLGIRRVGQQVV